MKLWRIFFVNLLLLFIFLFFINFLCFKVENDTERSLWGVSSKFSLERKSYSDYYEDVKRNIYLAPVGLNYSKKPVVVFGCSFAYGQNLGKNQNFSYKLSNLTKRPVYNRALPGGSLQHMLYQLRLHELDSELKKAEYVVYVIIADHPTRLYNNTFGVLDDIIYLTYKNKNGILVEQRPKIKMIEGSYLVKEVQKISTQKIKMNEKNQDKNFDYMKMYFEESNKRLKEVNPDAKFIILKYMDQTNCWYLNTNHWKELEREGFIVIDTKELTGKDFSLKKYKLSDGHPKEIAWDLISRAFVKRFNL